MYTVYIIFAVVLGLSFITGNIILLVEHKLNNKNKVNYVFDKEII